MIKKIKKILEGKASFIPLILTKELKDSYLTPSVGGGKLLNKKVIVFGGTGGIGLATVERFLVEGAIVTIVGRSESKLNDVCNYLNSRGYSNYNTIQLDSLDIQKVREYFKVNSFTEYDIFVNSIGIYAKEDGQGAFRNISSDLYFNELNTNFKSAVFLTEQVLAAFLKKNSGTIINISSINSNQRKFRHTPYGISKFALSSYTSHKAKELCGTNVTINVLQPGGVATNMPNVNVTLGRDIAGRKTNLLHRASLPEEMAAIIAFLSSPAGKNINGQILTASACEEF